MRDEAHGWADSREGSDTELYHENCSYGYTFNKNGAKNVLRKVPWFPQLLKWRAGDDGLIIRRTRAAIPGAEGVNHPVSERKEASTVEPRWPPCCAWSRTAYGLRPSLPGNLP
jgi:hypothetical protein